MKSDLERTDLNKDKTGQFIGAYAINPVSGKEIPIWIADYVLMGYGTGAIMAVPAHDERDWEFAKKFNLPIIEVIKGGNVEKAAYTEDGELVNSDFLNGLKVEESKFKMIRWLEEKGIGDGAVNFKLKDWVFSRQRYWGEPIPIVHCKKCGAVPLNEKDLPLLLPDVKNYEPTGTGESPLAAISDWVNTKCPKCGGPARRETNTMPQWAGSCWYYLRYLSPKDSKSFASKKEQDYWMNVDLYVGGAEHAVLHLLYARFWHKVLYDLGFVRDKEPFKKLMNQGLILGEDNEKMSKSRGNVVNPDEVIKRYGADTLRLYEMFMGPFDAVKPWSTKNIEGCFRFLQKVWRLAEESELIDDKPSDDLNRLLHKTIKKVGEDIENFAFNTAISHMMILANEMMKEKKLSTDVLEKLILVLTPFAPHLCEEIWEKLGNKKTLAYENWPEYDNKLVVDNTFELVFAVNGKKRSVKEVPVDISETEAINEAMSDINIQRNIEGKEIVKKIYVKGKLVNIVIR
jgi:leucyl-tRNA synthetase